MIPDPMPTEAELDRAYTQWEREQKQPVVYQGPMTQGDWLAHYLKYYPQALPPEWENCE